MVSRPLVARVEVFDKLSCEASPSGLGAVDYVSGTISDSFDGVLALDRLRLIVPRATYYLTALVPGRILRVLYLDGGYDEFRLTELADTSDDGLVEVRADGVVLDLARGLAKVSALVGTRRVFEVDVAAATLSSILTSYVLPDAPAYFSLGTITPSEVIALGTVSGMPLAVARAGVEAANVAAGVTYRLSARRNGTTDYKLDVTDLGASAATAYLRETLNLRRLARSRSSLTQANRAYPIGADGRGLGDAWFEVTAVSVNSYLEIAPIDGEATNPIPADDVFNTSFYAFMLDSNTAYQITDTDRANRRLSMNPTPASPVGKWLRIAASSGGNEVAALDEPVSQASYGVIVGELTSARTGRTSVTPNGDASDWTGARPAGWTGSGTAPTQATAVGDWETGGWSIKYSSVANASTLSPAQNVYVPTGGILTVMARVRVDATGDHVIRFSDPNGGPSIDVALDTTWSELGAYVYITKQFTIASGGAKSATAGIVTGTVGTGTTLLDHVNVLVGAEIPGRYVRHSEAAGQWLEAARFLEERAAPVASYTARVANLTRLDGTRYPNAALTLGGTAVLRSDTLLGAGGDVTARIVGLDSDLVDAMEDSVQIATAPRPLSALLAGGIA